MPAAFTGISCRRPEKAQLFMPFHYIGFGNNGVVNLVLHVLDLLRALPRQLARNADWRLREKPGAEKGQ